MIVATGMSGMKTAWSFNKRPPLMWSRHVGCWTCQVCMGVSLGDLMAAILWQNCNSDCLKIDQKIFDF